DFKNIKAACGITRNFDDAETRHVVDKMTQAELSLPPSAAPDRHQRAVAGALIEYDLRCQVLKATGGEGYNSKDEEAFKGLMKSFFGPGGEQSKVQPATVHEVMSDFCREGRVPNPAQLERALGHR